MMIGKHLATAAVISLGLVGSSLTGAYAQSLKIGVVVPLTGGGAPWGNATAQAAKIAAAEVNAAGGLEVSGKKYQVEVIAYDDQYKAAEALAAYNRLINNDHVKYMLSLASPSMLALQPHLENDKVIMLTSAGVEKAVDPKSKYVFRMVSTLKDYVPATVGWVKENVKLTGKRVAILNPNDDFRMVFDRHQQESL